MEAIEDLLVEVLVDCLTLRYELMMDHNLLVEEYDQHDLVL